MIRTCDLSFENAVAGCDIDPAGNFMKDADEHAQIRITAAARSNERRTESFGKCAGDREHPVKVGCQDLGRTVSVL
jgi:hypothetical protein